MTRAARGAAWLRARAGRARRRAALLVPPRLRATLVVAAGLLGTGTLGYRLIEGGHWSYFDGFYMTAITLTTIGYGETHPLSVPGRAFTVALAYGGIFTLAYFASELVRSVVSGELRDLIGRQWVDDQLAELSGHVVVCGFGRMGHVVCAELDRERRRFVVIDAAAAALAPFPFRQGLPLAGDATADELLRKAGVERAAALIAVVGSDAANLYITLAARLLNPRLLIVARAEEAGAEAKLRKVGANKVVCPYLAGGHRAVQAVVRPTVLQFMEMSTRAEFQDLQFEEVRVEAGSRLCGMTVGGLHPLLERGVVVVGLLRPGGELAYNPPGATSLDAGTVVLALGPRAQLERLERLAAVGDGPPAGS